MFQGILVRDMPLLIINLTQISYSLGLPPFHLVHPITTLHQNLLLVPHWILLKLGYMLQYVFGPCPVARRASRPLRPFLCHCLHRQIF